MLKRKSKKHSDKISIFDKAVNKVMKKYGNMFKRLANK